MTSVLTVLYKDFFRGEEVDFLAIHEGLLKGEQHNVLTTMYEDLLIGEQVDVLTAVCEGLHIA